MPLLWYVHHLENNDWKSLLSVAIERACVGQNWALTAFVFMPEHVHLLIYPLSVDARVGGFLKAIKRPFYYRIKKFLQLSEDPLLKTLTVRQRPNVMTFRFWQEGPGYDRNMMHEKSVRAAIDYLHMNPVRRGLCQRVTDWAWSSARWYAAEGLFEDKNLPRLTALPSGFFVGSADHTPH